MCLIYLSPVPWESFAQRPQKFVEWFHKRTGRQVFWVEPYPTRFPKLTDLKRVRATKAATPKEIPSWLRIATPHAIPLEPIPGSGWLNEWFWRPLISEMITFVGGQKALVVVGKPSILALAVLDKIKPCHSVYDAMDDFPAFYEGLSRRAMVKHELRLVQSVSKVWVSSSTLKLRWSRTRENVILIPNALDGTLLPPPNLSKGTSKNKVFGYVGTIGKWFDWAWLIALAKSRPDDVVRLIGPHFLPAPQQLPTNIELLPPCPHNEALSAMRNFDVGLIPFKRNELTKSVDPIKYYEYRALGLPVISTNFGEMEFRANESGIFLSSTIGDIDKVAAIALKFQDNPKLSNEFARRNTWDARFDAAPLCQDSCHLTC